MRIRDTIRASDRFSIALVCALAFTAKLFHTEVWGRPLLQLNVSVLEMSRDSEPSSRPRLAEQLALLDELRHVEMRALSAQVASVLGHMIGTPLNVIVGRAALLRASPTADSMIDHARRIEEQAHRLTERVQRLIHYLTPPEPRHELRAAQSVVEDAVGLYAPIARERNVSLTAGEDQCLATSVEGIPALMVLSALLSLAIRDATTHSALELNLRECVEESQVVFSIAVPGMAIPEFSVNQMEPPAKYDLEEAQPERELSVCAAIARRTGGRLEVVPGEAGVNVEYYCASVGGVPAVAAERVHYR